MTFTINSQFFIVITIDSWPIFFCTYHWSLTFAITIHSFHFCFDCNHYCHDLFVTITKGVKKPYNPALGEIFRSNFELPDGSTLSYFAEQVCITTPDTKNGPVLSEWFIDTRIV